MEGREERKEGRGKERRKGVLGFDKQKEGLWAWGIKTNGWESVRCGGKHG